MGGVLNNMGDLSDRAIALAHHLRAWALGAMGPKNQSSDALSDGSPERKSRKTEPKANPKCDVTGAETDSDCQPCDKWGLVYLKRDASGTEELSPRNSPHLMRALEKVRILNIIILGCTILHCNIICNTIIMEQNRRCCHRIWYNRILY